MRYAIEPDIVVFAKAVTSGYAPLGGVLVGPRVAAPFWDGPASAVFRHGYTYSGHSMACATAIANLDILDDEGLVDRVAMLEPILAASLHRLDSAPFVEEVRTVGLTGAVAIDPDVIIDARASWTRSSPRHSTMALPPVSCVDTLCMSPRRS